MLSRSSLAAFLVLALAGGALAWFALRDGARGGARESDGPHLLVKSLGTRGFAQRIVNVHLEELDAEGRPTRRHAGISPAPPEGLEQRGSLPADFTRFRVRLLVTPAGRSGRSAPSDAVPRPIPNGSGEADEHVMGPYEIAVGAGGRVLQIGVVLEGLSDLDGERPPADEPTPFSVRVTARARSATGAESFQTFGALTVR